MYIYINTIPLMIVSGRSKIEVGQTSELEGTVV
jgi:hypothetical protein